MSTLALLRAGTRDAHAALETVPALARLTAPDLTRAEYVRLLQHMEAFHAACEPAAAAGLVGYKAAAALLDGARPRALAQDLRWFDAVCLPPPPLPHLHETAAALGALYVVEGSGLGGRVIARHVARSLGVEPGRGGSFYGGLDAEAARLRWVRLCAVLDAPPDRLGICAASVVASARETFACLDQSLRTLAPA